MNKDQLHVFYSAMMTGLFVGIIDTLICLFYNVFYRSYSGFFPSELINVSSIIFAVNLLLLLLGLVFFLFIKAFKGGDGAFAVLMLVLTIIFAYKVFAGHPYSDARMDSGYHGLYGGMLIILGVSAACIPLLYRNKKFLDAVI
jgi:hypothetical protein